VWCSAGVTELREVIYLQTHSAASSRNQTYPSFPYGDDVRGGRSSRRLRSVPVASNLRDMDEIASGHLPWRAVPGRAPSQ